MEKHPVDGTGNASIDGSSCRSDLEDGVGIPGHCNLSYVELQMLTGNLAMHVKLVNRIWLTSDLVNG